MDHDNGVAYSARLCRALEFSINLFKVQTRKSKILSQIEVPFASGKFQFSLRQGATINSRILLAIADGLAI